MDLLVQVFTHSCLVCLCSFSADFAFFCHFFHSTQDPSSKITGHMTGVYPPPLPPPTHNLIFPWVFRFFERTFSPCLDLCSDETDNSPPLQLHTLKQFEQVRAFIFRYHGVWCEGHFFIPMMLHLNELCARWIHASCCHLVASWTHRKKKDKVRDQYWGNKDSLTQEFTHILQPSGEHVLKIPYWKGEHLRVEKCGWKTPRTLLVF